MKGILQPDKKTIIGPVTMDEPECWNWKVTTDGPPCPICKEYRQHLASLPSIPAIGFEGHQPGEVSYVEGYQMTTYKKEVWYACSHEAFLNTKDDYRRIVATPSPQGAGKGRDEVDQTDLIWTMDEVAKEIESLVSTYKKENKNIRSNDFRLGAQAVFYRYVKINKEWHSEHIGPKGVDKSTHTPTPSPQGVNVYFGNEKISPEEKIKVCESPTYTLTAEQLVAFGEAMIHRGAWHWDVERLIPVEPPDMKTYLKQQFNIEI